MTPPLLKIDEAREQVRALEDAIRRLREQHADANPRALAAYLGSLVEELWRLRAQVDAALGLDRAVTDSAALWVSLRGGTVGEGKAPAYAIGKVLEAIQTGVKQTAAYIETRRAFLRGVPKEIAQEVALDMVALAPGSARIALATASPQFRVDLPRPLVEVALESLLRAAEWAETGGDDVSLEKLLGETIVRRQVASRIREIAPSTTGPYEYLEFSGAVLGEGRRILMTARAYQHAAEYLKRRTIEEGSYKGQLVAIDIEKDLFSLRHAGRRIHCAFGTEVAEEARHLVGEFVEVTGEGLFHEDEELPYRINVTRLRKLRHEEHRDL